MQIAANAKSLARRLANDETSSRLAGLMIVSLFPAFFWTTLVGGIGTATGHSPSAMSLMTIGAAIAVFCAAVGQLLSSRN
jgi:hypothetical protein